MSAITTLGQTVFARWSDGYYYPAIVDEIWEQGIQISFLDGEFGLVPPEQIVELEEAFQKMQLQGNWKYEGIYFKGRLNTCEPMIMYYNDGDVEQIELGQLRGARPGEPVVWKQAASLLAVAGIVIFGVYAVIKKRKNRNNCCSN